MRINSEKSSVGAIACFVSAVLFVSPVLGAEAAAIPNLSGQWGRNMLNLEPPPSGPSPVVNSVRAADGTMDHDVPVGDFTNPILKPEAVEILRQRGEISLRGRAFSSAHNQCWPEPPPFTLVMQYGMQLIQQNDEVILVYVSDHKVRHIRLNEPHPADLVPTWQGNSVGHYEGDTLVIDTVGIKLGPLSAVDRYGTPHSEALHVIERYRLIDGKAAREATRRNEDLYNSSAGGQRDDFHPYGRGNLDPDTTQMGLQVEVMVEDPNTFTVPWSGLITYRRILGDWPEAVCAENAGGNVGGLESTIPTADRPDF